jgi:isoleucyl-tRNA synthetase
MDYRIHVMARAIKDIFCRYKTQKGFQVKRKAGYGLPVELGTEKELGITKEDIESLFPSNITRLVKNRNALYRWNDLTEKNGYWVDMEDPYVTYKPKYMETVWLLKQIYNRFDVQRLHHSAYSPKAGTGLIS